MNGYVTIKVDLETPEEQIRLLQTRLIEYVTLKPKLYRPECLLAILDMGTANMLTLRLSIPHKHNWQDGAKRWNVQTDFLFALKKNLLILGIKFVLPVQPVLVENK